MCKLIFVYASMLISRGPKSWYPWNLFFKVFRFIGLAQGCTRWVKTVQSGAKSAQRCSQDGPSVSQDGLKMTEGPKWCQEGSKMLPRWSKQVQSGPRGMPRDGPMLASTWPNLAQNGDKMAPGVVQGLCGASLKTRWEPAFLDHAILR